MYISKLEQNLFKTEITTTNYVSVMLLKGQLSWMSGGCLGKNMSLAYLGTFHPKFISNWFSDFREDFQELSKY